MADLKESSLFKDLQEQSRHWYYHHKVRVIRDILSPGLRQLVASRNEGSLERETHLKCMDIGAGNGIISRALGTRLAGMPVAWDLVDSAYSADEIGPDPVDPAITLFAAIPDGGVYDLIVAIDVMEHVEDESDFLERLLHHLAPDGLMLICVPAFQVLWSSHDIFLGHYRRYRVRRLMELMSGSGLQILDSGYLYVLLFPFIATIRILSRLRSASLHGAGSPSGSDLKIYPTAINALLRRSMGLERRALAKFPFLGRHFGLSCYALARMVAD